jgi:hypothetical protein
VQGTIAQLAALTMHGNAYLRGHPLGAFWPANSAFQFCKRVEFVAVEAEGEAPYAPDPHAWLERMRADGLTEIRLHRAPRNDAGISDRQSSAFVGGGGRWLMETVRGAASDLWDMRWEVGDRDDPERRIWNVTYGRTATGIPVIPIRPVDLEGLRGELLGVLLAIEAFAAAHEPRFAGVFRAALGALESDAPLTAMHGADLAPDGVLPLAAQQLLAAAQHAWVFGGMGSWNDLRFDGADQETYERLSDDLFNLLSAAICAAANASAGEGSSASPVLT